MCWVVNRALEYCLNESDLRKAFNKALINFNIELSKINRLEQYNKIFPNDPRTADNLVISDKNEELIHQISHKLKIASFQGSEVTVYQV
jgi:uncharacterized membrane protein